MYQSVISYIHCSIYTCKQNTIIIFISANICTNIFLRRYRVRFVYCTHMCVFVFRIVTFHTTDTLSVSPHTRSSTLYKTKMKTYPAVYSAHGVTKPTLELNKKTPSRDNDAHCEECVKEGMRRVRQSCISYGIIYTMASSISIMHSGLASS